MVRGYLDKSIQSLPEFGILVSLFYPLSKALPFFGVGNGPHNKLFSGIIFKSSLFLLLFLVGIVFATHNPSVSHSANSVTNGAFPGDYHGLEVGL